MDHRMLQPAADNVAGTRFCSNCSQNKKSANGFWKVYANGKNRRWICNACGTKKLNETKATLQPGS